MNVHIHDNKVHIVINICISSSTVIASNVHIHDNKVCIVINIHIGDNMRILSPTLVFMVIHTLLSCTYTLMAINASKYCH